MSQRRQIERLCGGRDREALIRGLVQRELLEKAADPRSPHSPNVYRITATALAATGHPTLASLQASIAQGLVDAADE